MKNIPYSSTLLLFFSLIIVSTSSKAQFGFYLTKEDYLKKKITVLEKMQISENYNVGVLKYVDKKNVEHKTNCLKEKYWGFRYIDSCDYIQMDGFFAKIVITGRIDLLISPKATYTIDAEGKYWFNKADDDKINFYFVKNLNPLTVAPFEKHIADDKEILKEYQTDRDNHGEFINKQFLYLKKYNSSSPKAAKKGAKK